MKLNAMRGLMAAWTEKGDEWERYGYDKEGAPLRPGQRVVSTLRLTASP